MFYESSISNSEDFKDGDLDELDEKISQSQFGASSVPESGFSPGRPHIKVISAQEYYDLTNSSLDKS